MEIRPTPITEIHDPLLSERGVRLLVKREDLNHPELSGNKWRKLKYNLQEAKKQGKKTLLSFGGAYSNHIYALAAAGKHFGFETIGVIRGEEHSELNSTLSFAKDCGMHLHYIDRSTYRNKHSHEVVGKLRDELGDFYLIPEGGTNQFAIQGCAEIIKELDLDFDVICCPVGTGGTITGLIKGLNGEKKTIGFSALKGDFLIREVAELLQKYGTRSFENWSIQTDYHFGGYAKTKPELTDFIHCFESKYQIPIEPIYTGKMFYGIFDLIEKRSFQEGTTLLALHTGGLQGRTI